VHQESARLVEANHYEDGDPFPRKSKDRSALDDKVATPTLETIDAHQPKRHLFRCLIPSAENAGHYLGLLWR
jgi:hypothetical protein